MRIFRLPANKQLTVDERQGVSVIICAKNEAENLRKNLPVVLSQRYANAAGKLNYEVIVANDSSTDDTVKVVEGLGIGDWGLLRCVNSVSGGKKNALRMGTECARNEWLVLIDADCVPDSDRWLELMVAPLSNPPALKLRRTMEIVAGYGGYNEKPGLLNAFIRWETMHTFLQYSTYMLAGLPYMAVGRNMACTKSILQEAQQSELWNVLPSGDDDLLVRVAGTAENMAIVCDAAAFTHTEAKATWKEWVKQKQRHLSTGKYYKGNIKILLGGYGISHALVWLGFAGMIIGKYWNMAVIVMAVRCIIYWLLWAVTADKLRERKLILFFPFFDIAWLIYNFAFLPYITWKNKEQWK